jgi:cardiolipin synthase
MLFTIPNLFTMVRIVMTPFVIYAFSHGHFLLGGWLFGGAAFTDLLDGAIARRFGGISKVGLYLDPIADKILLSSTFIGLAAGGAVPVWVVVLIFARDLWILLLSSYALKYTTFRDLNPSQWGKLSTFSQVMTAVFVMAAEGYRSPELRRIADFLIVVVAAFAAVSAVDYSRRGITWLRTQSTRN